MNEELIATELLPSSLIVKCAGSHLYKIGLSLFPYAG
jgi:hypothetical protein